MSLIGAIIFDLDNTLWDVHPVIHRAEHALLAFLTVHYPRIVERHDIESMRARSSASLSRSRAQGCR